MNRLTLLHGGPGKFLELGSRQTTGGLDRDLTVVNVTETIHASLTKDPLNFDTWSTLNVFYQDLFRYECLRAEKEGFGIVWALELISEVVKQACLASS